MAIAVTNDSTRGKFIRYKVNGMSKSVWVEAFGTAVIAEAEDYDSLLNSQSRAKNRLHRDEKKSSITRNLIKLRGGFGFDESDQHNRWGGQVAIIDNEITGKFISSTFNRIARSPKTLYYRPNVDVTEFGSVLYTYPENKFVHQEEELLEYGKYRVNHKGGSVIHKSSAQFNNILPNEMGIIINSDDPKSAALGAQYQAAWNIPSNNVITVSLGSGHDIGWTGPLNTARTTISNDMPATVQWLALCFEKPSRVNDNSITWAITMGFNSIDVNTNPLPTNPMYNFQGSHPYDVLGIRPSMLVWSGNVITAATQAHATGPQGTGYMFMANDQGGQPRGRSRQLQMQTMANNLDYSPEVTFDLTNNLNGSQAVGSNQITNKPDLMFYFNGMYQLTGMDTNTVIGGAIGDYVTSWGGYLPNGNAGQTPMTYLLENGIVATCGTVDEPWQNGIGGGSPYQQGAGDLADQWSDITMLVPRYIEGDSSISSYWRSMKQPPRTLVAGDPMVSPFANVTGTTTGMTAVSGTTGCTIPYAINYDPDSTFLGVNCIFWRYGFRMDNVSTVPSSIQQYTEQAGFWANFDETPGDLGVPLQQPTTWKQATISNENVGSGNADIMTVDDYNTTYPINVVGCKAVDYHHLSIDGNSYQWMNSHLQVRPSTGSTAQTEVWFVDPTMFADPDTGGMVSEYKIATRTMGQRSDDETEVRFVFPKRVTLTSMVGKGVESSNNACPMSFSYMGAIVDIPQADQFPPDIVVPS